MKLLLTAILILCLRFVSISQVILYENHFEVPNFTPTGFNCRADICVLPVDSIFGGTGTGTSGGARFKQEYTVETLLITKLGHEYGDSTHIGGNYSLGMLATAENDKLALTINTLSYPFLHIIFDFSGISSGGGGCGIIKAENTPIMLVQLFNTPSNLFSFVSPGALLDQKTVSGNFPDTTNIFNFTWTPVSVNLNNIASTNGYVTIVFDLLQCNYASIDNLKIVGDSLALPLKLKSFSLSTQNKTVYLKWQTVNELNFKHFEIESSSDSRFFVPFAIVPGKLSEVQNDYSFIDNSLWLSDKKYYRLKMVDKDGKFTYSKVISAKLNVIAKAVIFPNPVISTAAIQLQSEHAESVTLKIVSSDGKVLSTNTYNLTAGNNLIALNTEVLAAGVYAVVITGQNINEHLTFSKQ